MPKKSKMQKVKRKTSKQLEAKTAKGQTQEVKMQKN